jgi:hypothetical protein
MPDLKTALTVALTQPAKAAKELIETTKNDFQANKGKPFSTGVVVTTFNYIRDHPGCTSKEVNKILNAKGYPDTSVSSVITKLIHRELVNRDEDGRLNTTKLEYKLDRRHFKNRNKKPVTKPRAKPIPKWKPPALLPMPEPTVYTKPSLIDTISIREAKELYIELKKIFGKE